jgi:manganese/zinc/iron transport system substrate-binding protein
MEARMTAKGLLLVVALAGAPVSAAAQTPQVVATTGMVGDVAAAVAGPCAEISVMMGPGIDPHLYRPSAGDVRAIFDADMLLYSGHNLEGQLGAVLGRLEGRKPILAVAEAAVPDRSDLIFPEASETPDPHLWMSADLWARAAPAVAEGLTRIAPDCADAMTERAAEYSEAVHALHRWIQASVATIPQERRVLITAHDAFAYYGKAYGIEVVGIQGVSTDTEAGIGDIRATVDLVVARAIPAIFIESTINPRTVEAVIAAAQSRGHPLALGGELYSDALGEDGTPSGTYIGMPYENTRAIVEALGGNVAPLPEALRPWAERWNIGG